MTPEKTPSADDRRFAGLLTASIAGVFAICCFISFKGHGVDLLPVWLAGKMWATGEPGLIYATDTRIFTMSAPSEWADLARAEGAKVSSLFPFIYAPIWAAAVAPLTTIMDFDTFNAIFRAVNPVLLTMIPWLLWRAAPCTHAVQQIGTGTVLLVMTTVGILPIMGNQVQILVAFLLALTIERSRNGGQVAAGVALGLAAALKLYPAVLVVLFLATRQPRAVAAFGVAGGALGAMSLVVAGWPLHAHLLDQLSVISATVMQVNLSANVDALLVAVMDMHLDTSVPGRPVVEKTALWLWLSRLALIGSLTALVVAGRRRPEIAEHPLFWPLAILMVSLFGPLSWVFHYIVPVAAAPLLLAVWPRRATWMALVVLGLSTSLLTMLWPFPAPYGAPPLQVWASGAFLALAVVFALAIHGSARRKL
jgi:hypothetical protein